MRRYAFLPCLGLTLSAILFATAPVYAQDNHLGNELARVEVRFTELDEKLRTMQGRIEEVEYENRRLREVIDRFQQDANMRLTDLENAKPIVAPVAEETPSASSDDAEEKLVAPVEQPKAEKAPAVDAKKFANARALYDHGFALLNQAQYAKAGEAFESFIKSYPKDPLIGHAFYWAGETYYVRQNYTQAVDYFKQGYEALPAGPKAGDNLLKLGMALNNVKRNTEACVILKQVIAKFGNSPSIKGKAEQERNRAGCK